MTARNDIATAMLATVFGAALLAIDETGEGSTARDPRTARELAVIARVLEKRLGETRRAFVTAASPPQRELADTAKAA